MSGNWKQKRLFIYFTPVQAFQNRKWHSSWQTETWYPYFLIGKSALFFRKRGVEGEALTFRSPPVVSKEVSQEAVTHTCLCLPTANCIGGDWPRRPIEPHTGNTQGAGSLRDRNERSEFQSLAAPAGGPVGVPLKPGGYSGGTHPMACRSGRNLRVAPGTAKLKCCVVRALTAQDGGRSHSYGVQSESLSKCSDLWSSTKVFPCQVTSYCFVSSVQKVLSAFAPYIPSQTSKLSYAMTIFLMPSPEDSGHR